MGQDFDESQRHRLDNPGVRHGNFRSFLLKRPSAAPTTVALEGWKTDHGEWWQKNRLAIRNIFQANSHDSPRCVGTKTTLEFIPTGAKKAVLGMTQYNMLRPRENSDGLYLDEELSLWHVFPLEPKVQIIYYTAMKSSFRFTGQRSGCAADQFQGFYPPPLCELRQEISEVDITKYFPIGTEDYSVDVPRQPWDNFIKIYTKDPKLIYAACTHCNTMLKLKGGASCCTKSLINHSKTDVYSIDCVRRPSRNDYRLSS